MAVLGSIVLVLFLNLEYSNAGKVEVLAARHHKLTKRDTGSLQGTPDQDSMPHEMELRIDIDGAESVKLDLVRNDHVNSGAPVVIGDGGSLTAWRSADRQTYAVYTDIANSAAMFVKARNGDTNATQHDFMGIFQKEDKKFTVEPPGREPDGPIGTDDKTRRRRRRRSARGRSRRKRSPADEGLPDYIISPVHPPILTYEYDLEYGLAEHDLYKDELLEIVPESYNIGDKYVSYGVEVLVVVDYAIYRRYYDMSEATTKVGRRDDAINQIRFYYSHIINGVDLRYMSIKEADLGVYVRLSGFYIPMTPADAPWAERSDLREVDNKTRQVFTHAYRAISKLESWISIVEDNLPVFDQASVFFGNKLFGGYSSSGSRRNIAGLAQIGGVCTKYRAALCQENGQYASTQTASHEMGHSLGAFHDGSQNKCNKASQNIMAPTPVKLSTVNFYNPYKFSKCSAQEIRRYIHILSARKINCLLNFATHVNQTELEIHLQTPPGQMFSLDQQCQNIFGYLSYYCGGELNDEIMCVELICYDPFQKRCWKGPERRAATGTTCGNKKWCIRGKCIPDNKAPEAKDSCLTGDLVDKLPDGTTCADITPSTPMRCYTEKYRRACCTTCDILKDTAHPDCMYGDRFSWCKSVQNRRSDCYNPNIRHDCCGRCRRETTGIEGCQWGDKATWCEKDVPKKPQLCYNSQKTCCLSCHKLDVGPSGCEYGNRATWCKVWSDRPYECYQSHFRSTCCDLCEKVHRQYGRASSDPSAPDCHFGDRVRSCGRHMCSDRRNWANCCYTCRREAGYTAPVTARPTTPTTPTTTPTTPTTTPTTPTTTTRTTTPTTRTTIPTTPTTIPTTRTTTPTTPTTTPTTRTTIPTTPTTIPTTPTTTPTTRTTTPTTPTTTPTTPTTTTPTTTPTTRTTRPTTPTTTTPTTTTQTTPTTTTRTSTTTTRTSTSSRSETPSRSKECVDHAEWCASLTEARACYKADVDCCATCSSMSQNVPGCKYGDIYDECVNITYKDCQNAIYQKGCCQKCQELSQKPVLTDKATWCVSVAITHCYYINVTCPARCAQHYTGIKDCEYGDHYTWCGNMTLFQCQDPGVKKGCCVSCPDRVEEAKTRQKTTKMTTKSTTVKSTSSSSTDTSTTTRRPETVQVTRNTFKHCEEEVRGSDCYLRSFQEKCYETCQKYLTGDPDCKYGDRYSWCDGVEEEDCTYAEYQYKCCWTCHKVYCVDKASWCMNMSAWSCYQDRDVCCKTCKSMFTGNGGCEYGDRVGWCEAAIDHPRDCERKDIIMNCCATCSKYGYNIPEKETELDEGALLEFLSSMDEILKTQKLLLHSVVKHLNIFCVKNVQKCCGAFGVNSSSSQTEFVNKMLSGHDVAVAAGYPKEETLKSIWNKLLVSIASEHLKGFCDSAGSDRDSAGSEVSRKKRSSSTSGAILYFDKSVLHEVLSEYKTSIEQDTNLKILKIALPGDLSRDTKPAFTGTLYLVLPVCLGAIIIALVVCIIKVKYSKLLTKKHCQVSPQSKMFLHHGKIPTVFNSNSFTRQESERPQVFCRSKSCKEARKRQKATVKSQPSQLWAKQLLYVEERTVHLYGGSLPDLLDLPAGCLNVDDEASDTATSDVRHSATDNDQILNASEPKPAWRDAE